MFPQIIIFFINDIKLTCNNNNNNNYTNIITDTQINIAVVRQREVAAVGSEVFVVVVFGCRF